MSDVKTFWNGDHELTAAERKMGEDLMPMSGNCASLQGELYRASTRISYDWYNNGWGCNNWSGAVVFLKKFFGELPVQPSAEVRKELDRCLNYVHDYSHGESARHLDNDKMSGTTLQLN